MQNGTVDQRLTSDKNGENICKLQTKKDHQISNLLFSTVFKQCVL